MSQAIRLFLRRRREAAGIPSHCSANSFTPGQSDVFFVAMAILALISIVLVQLVTM